MGFCSILIIYVVVVAIIDAYGYMNGDLYKLYGPIDAAGNFCGITKGFEDYRNLYILNPKGNITEQFKSAVCVKECPSKSNQKVSCKPITLKDKTKLACPLGS